MAGLCRTQPGTPKPLSTAGATVGTQISVQAERGLAGRGKGEEQPSEQPRMLVLQVQRRPMLEQGKE